MTEITESTRFDVLAPLGMTLTDRRGKEHDHPAGDVVTFAQLNTSVRHVRTLLRVGDLGIHGAIPPAPKALEPDPEPELSEADQEAYGAATAAAEAVWGGYG